MLVIHHAMLPRHVDTGCCRQTVAGADVGDAPFEVQVLAIEAGRETPTEARAEARVVVAVAGSGKLVLESGSERFHAPCTLLVPAGAPHRFINNAAVPLQLVCVQAHSRPSEAA